MQPRANRKVDYAELHTLISTKNETLCRLLTFTEIATHFGASYERIRQIAKQRYGLTAKDRDCRAPAVFRAYTPRVFVRIVRGWLREVGFWYCGLCHAAVTTEKMSVNNTRPAHSSVRCKACAAARNRERYRTDPQYRAKLKAWAQSGKGKQSTNKASTEWRRRNRERVREYQRHYWQRRRPEARG